MKNLILKTALITFSLILAIVFISYAFMAAFIPKNLAVFWESTENYNLSIKYYEKQYNKTADINDLMVLCDKVNEENDLIRSEKYLSEFIENTLYAEKCSDRDKNLTLSKTGISSKQFYEGKYVVCVYYLYGESRAKECAESFVSEKDFLLLIIDNL